MRLLLLHSDIAPAHGQYVTADHRFFVLYMAAGENKIAFNGGSCLAARTRHKRAKLGIVIIHPGNLSISQRTPGKSWPGWVNSNNIIATAVLRDTDSLDSNGLIINIYDAKLPVCITNTDTLNATRNPCEWLPCCAAVSQRNMRLNCCCSARGSNAHNINGRCAKLGAG